MRGVCQVRAVSLLARPPVWLGLDVGVSVLAVATKTPWRDGTTHLVMSPLEFMQRLAALVPRPRLHLVRFHGVLAPNAKLRAKVVPKVMPEQEEAATEVTAAGECGTETVQGRSRPHRISWARLRKRAVDIDMQHGPNCGAGEPRIIAAIL
jgi:Putative transposase